MSKNSYAGKSEAKKQNITELLEELEKVIVPENKRYVDKNKINKDSVLFSERFAKLEEEIESEKKRNAIMKNILGPNVNFKDISNENILKAISITNTIAKSLDENKEILIKNNHGIDNEGKSEYKEQLKKYGKFVNDFKDNFTIGLIDSGRNDLPFTSENMLSMIKRYGDPKFNRGAILLNEAKKDPVEFVKNTNDIKFSVLMDFLSNKKNGVLPKENEEIAQKLAEERARQITKNAETFKGGNKSSSLWAFFSAEKSVYNKEIDFVRNHIAENLKSGKEWSCGFVP